VLIIDGVFSTYGSGEAMRVLESVRQAMHGKTLVVTLPEGFDASDFDQIFLFEGPRVTTQNGSSSKEFVQAAPHASPG
jgi:hypothetical protein